MAVDTRFDESFFISLDYAHGKPQRLALEYTTHLDKNIKKSYINETEGDNNVL